MIAALVGRFKDQPTIYLFGHLFQGQTLVMLANTALLIGVFLLLFEMTKKK